MWHLGARCSCHEGLSMLVRRSRVRTWQTTPWTSLVCQWSFWPSRLPPWAPKPDRVSLWTRRHQSNWRCSRYWHSALFQSVWPVPVFPSHFWEQQISLRSGAHLMVSALCVSECDHLDWEDHQRLWGEPLGYLAWRLQRRESHRIRDFKFTGEQRITHYRLECFLWRSIDKRKADLFTLKHLITTEADAWGGLVGCATQHSAWCAGCIWISLLVCHVYCYDLPVQMYPCQPILLQNLSLEKQAFEYCQSWTFRQSRQVKSSTDSSMNLLWSNHINICIKL